ncbi:hypothetical protein DL95DRAFT_415169 [Leptodontidium sp. 2 PMI_412]|nr:hypothetical protein DL95DRAFT_415169 [Leptodontidium sp. 2 PMI_412]
MPILASMKYRVVIKKGNKTHLTYLVTSPADTPRLGMAKLHGLVKSRGLSTYSGFGIGPLFKLSLETALSSSSLEAQDTFKEIIIASSEPNPALTKSFNNPSLVSHALFAPVGEKVLVPSSVNNIQIRKEAMLVKQHITVFGGLCALVAALIISLIVGTLMGVLAHDVKLGIMVASGVGALVACVEAYLMYAYK